MQQTRSTYRILSFSLALLVFFSSGGLILSKHNCQLKQKSQSEGISLSCADVGCKKGCCSTERHFFKLDQDQQTSHSDFELTKKANQFIIAFIATFFNELTLEKEVVAFKNYKPPLISKDIPVLIQSFLF